MSTRTRSLVALLATAAVVGVASGGGTLAVGATTPDATTPTSTTPPTPVNPAPPKATTGGAESLTRTTATLTGSVTPGLAETTYRFEYGTSTAYGLTTPTVTLPAGGAAVTVKQPVTGLTVGTRYHVRVVATNAAGTTRGADRTFTTAANPRSPTVSTPTVNAITPSSAGAVARVNPQGQGTSYYFQYGTSTRYGLRTGSVGIGSGTASVTVTAALTGLKANTKYYTRVVATNGTGITRSASRSFVTARALTGVGIDPERRQVTWNTGTSVRGTVGGSGVGGVKVALLRQDFPFSGPLMQVATQTTSSAGAYSFAVGPLYTTTRFQVITQGTPAVASRVMAIDSRPLLRLRISARKRTTMQLRGLVYPVIPSGRATVQRRTPKGRWVTVKRARLSHTTASNRSAYRVSVPRLAGRTARYRVRVSPRDAGAHVTATTKSVAVARRR